MPDCDAQIMVTLNVMHGYSIVTVLTSYESQVSQVANENDYK